VLSRKSLGVLDAWLTDIRELWLHHEQELAALPEEKRAEVLSALNVRRQVMNVSCFAAVQPAWAEDRKLEIHGWIWIYDIHDGLLHDLETTIRGLDDVPAP